MCGAALVNPSSLPSSLSASLFSSFAPHLKNNSQKLLAHVLWSSRSLWEDIYNEGSRGSGDDAASDYECGFCIRHR
jgi:hypothetical protein